MTHWPFRMAVGESDLWGGGEGNWRREGKEATSRRLGNGWPSVGRALSLLKRISHVCNGIPEDRAGFESTFQKLPESYSARSGPPTVTFCLLQ